MSTCHSSILQASRCAALALSVLAAGAATAQDARLDAACNSQMTRLQQRLYQRAEQGPGVLRDFIYIRRGMLQLDTYETAAWAESVRRASDVCMKRLAGAQPAAEAGLSLSDASAH